MSLLDENGLTRVWNKMKTWVGTKVQTDVPANAVFTDTKVTQTESSANENFEVLVSGTASTAILTEEANKSVGFRYNPNLKAVMEGTATTAGGNSSHAEGYSTLAGGIFSHVEGYYTTASHRGQHVFGEYNIADPSENDSDEKGNYVEIVGNGTASTHSNARTLDWSGNEVLSGKLTVGAAPTTDMDVATKKYVDDADNELSSSLTNTNLLSIQRVTLTETTGSTGNIALSYTNDGYTYIVGAMVSGSNAYIRAWVSSANGKWYFTAVDPNSGVTINNTSLNLRFLVVKIKTL